MRQNLGARLSQMRGNRAKKEHVPVETSPAVSPGKEWEQAGRYTFRRTLRVPDPVSALGLKQPFAKHLSFGRNSAPPQPGELLFFDLETTGLSAAPGTAVFLAGFGRIRETTLEITQFFLADYPGEAEFLQAILDFLPENPYWVSYNGKSFDAPMLISKGIIHGIPFSFPRHADLLHLSRRLWRRILPDCSLSTIESHILSIKRELDIPGAMAPQIYFDYHRTGEISGIEKIAAHHYEDIYSLGRLLAKISEISHSPASVQNVDPYGLGTLLADEPAGEEILLRGFREGSMRCGRLLAVLYKRAGRFREAVEIWERDASQGSIESAVELAKYYEHRNMNFESALHWTMYALNNQREDSEAVIQKLTRRLERIRGKLDRL